MDLFQDENGRWRIRTSDLCALLKTSSQHLAALAREGVIPRSEGHGVGAHRDLEATISGFVSDLRGIRTRPRRRAGQATDQAGEQG